MAREVARSVATVVWVREQAAAREGVNCVATVVLVREQAAAREGAESGAAAGWVGGEAAAVEVAGGGPGRRSLHAQRRCLSGSAGPPHEPATLTDATATIRTGEGAPSSDQPGSGDSG